MELVTGRRGPVHWTCLVGETSASTWDAYVDHLLRDLAPALAPGAIVLDIWHGCGSPPVRVRDRFARQFLVTPEVRHVRAHAVVTDSAMTRGALTAINWVIKRPFEERVFGQPAGALTWLKELAPELDVAGLMADIEAASPVCRDLRW